MTETLVTLFERFVTHYQPQSHLCNNNYIYIYNIAQIIEHNCCHRIHDLIRNQ